MESLSKHSFLLRLSEHIRLSKRGLDFMKGKSGGIANSWSDPMEASEWVDQWQENNHLVDG